MIQVMHSLPNATLANQTRLSFHINRFLPENAMSSLTHNIISIRTSAQRALSSMMGLYLISRLLLLVLIYHCGPFYLMFDRDRKKVQ